METRYPSKVQTAVNALLSKERKHPSALDKMIQEMNVQN
jgi:hypothetical protein